MPYFQNEKARLQLELQAVGAEIANLTAQLQVQQQAIATAQSQSSAAQTRLAVAQAQIPPLEAAARAADELVADLDEQIRDASEPDQQDPGDPGGVEWRRRLAALKRQRDQAQTQSTAARARLDNGRAVVSQATAEVQAAERQVAVVTNTAQVTQQAIAAAQQGQQAVQTEIGKLDRWNDEIARDPLDRRALEPLAAELSGRVAALEEAHAVARVQNEIATETLLALTARRDNELAPELNRVNAELPGASEELRVARLALGGVTRRIQMHLRGGPGA